MGHTKIAARRFREAMRISVLAALALAGCDSGAQAPFDLVVEIETAAGAPAGVHYQVNGAAVDEVWVQSYRSLDDACAQLRSGPVQVQCLTAGDESCGLSELDGVCCWAPQILTSPVVRGTVYVAFAGDGTHTTQEGHCVAQDGSSTHGDGPGPDAGP
jgi:hypothetical protein